MTWALASPSQADAVPEKTACTVAAQQERGFVRSLPYTAHGARMCPQLERNFTEAGFRPKSTDGLPAANWLWQVGNRADAAVEFSQTHDAHTCAGPQEAHTLLYNATLPGSLPSLIATLDGVRLFGNPKALSVFFQPFPAAQVVAINPVSAILSGIAFATMSATSLAQIVKERAVSKSTPTLLGMGLDHRVYWIALLISDACMMTAFFLLPTWILALALHVPYLTASGGTFLCFVMVCLSALLSSVAAIYCLSHLFRKPENAMTVVMISGIMLVELSYGMFQIMDVVVASQPSAFAALKMVNVLCLMAVPPFAIVSGMIALFHVHYSGGDAADAQNLLSTWEWSTTTGRRFVGPAPAVSLKRLLDESPWLQFPSECQRC
jgi:hypothetical protein